MELIPVEYPEYKTKEEVIKEYEERKQKNLDAIIDRQYSIENYDTDVSGKAKTCLVKYEDDKIVGSPCAFCYEHTTQNPFRSGAFVFSICATCFNYCTVIELYRSKGDEKVKVKTSKKMRQAKIDKRSLKIDWEKVEKQILNKQLTMGNFATSHKILPAEAKALLLEKYGAKLVVKRGRGGGITLV